MMVKNENSNNILDNMDKKDEKAVLSCIIITLLVFRKV